MTVTRSGRRRADGGGHVVALLVDGPVRPFELAIAGEVFGAHRAGSLSDRAGAGWYDLRVCAPSPGDDIDTGLGFSLTIPRGLDELAAADTVIVPTAPAGAVAAATSTTAWEAPRPPSPEVVEALRAAAARGARMVSFCGGAFHLAEAGLLDGRRATTHWLYRDAFAARYPRVELVPDVLYIGEGPVLSSAGSAAAIDLALHIVRHDHGAEIADEVARRMVVPPHRDGDQAQYARTALPAPDDRRVAVLLDWMVEHLDRPLSVHALARRAAMSDRTFARHFRSATGTTPHRWLTAQRITRARLLLETTELPVDVIASRAGFGSVVTFRSRFREVCGVSPSRYRERFRRGEPAGRTSP